MIADICSFPGSLEAGRPAGDENRGRLARIRRGDQIAARELVANLYPQVIQIVRAHRPRRTLEEDLAQEIFMKVFHRLRQFQGSVPFAHWVSRIAVTTCIDRLRAEIRRPELRRSDLSETEAIAFDSARGESVRDPVDGIAARELVGQLLDELEPADRMVIELYDLQQKSMTEVGRAMGIPPGLVKTRAFRARQKLRRRLEELEAEEELLTA